MRLADGRDVIQLTSTRADDRALRHAAGRGDLGARPQSARIHGAVRSAGVCAADAAAAAPVAAPITGGGERSGAIARPAPPGRASCCARAGRRASRSAAMAANTSCAAAIRCRHRPAASTVPAQTERAMIAIYRANPQAFEGNINRPARRRRAAPAGQRGRCGRRSGRSGRAKCAARSAAWSRAVRRRAAAAGTADPRLRLVPPPAAGRWRAMRAETQALRERVTPARNRTGRIPPPARTAQCRTGPPAGAPPRLRRRRRPRRRPRRWRSAEARPPAAPERRAGSRACCRAASPSRKPVAEAGREAGGRRAGSVAARSAEGLLVRAGRSAGCCCCRRSGCGPRVVAARHALRHASAPFAVRPPAAASATRAPIRSRCASP